MAQVTGSSAAITARGSEVISPFSHSGMTLYEDPFRFGCVRIREPSSAVMRLDFHTVVSSESPLKMVEDLVVRDGLFRIIIVNTRAKEFNPSGIISCLPVMVFNSIKNVLPKRSVRGSTGM
jgi:hypothetical protein